MDDAERGVAVAHVLDEDPNGVDVVDLAKLRALALHLLPDAVDVLRPSLQVRLNPRLVEPRPQLGDRAIDVGLAAPPARVEQLGEIAEALRLERLEREVLELPLHLPDPEPLGQRRVDLERLAGNSLLLLGRQAVQGAHVVQAVGQLDEDDPDVLGHREEHLPDVLGLLLLVAVGAEPGELGDPVDELRHLGAEPLLDVAEAELGVLGNVMQERGLDRDEVDPELRERLRRGDRVRDVVLAGGALLACVRLDGEVERVADPGEIRLGIVRSDRCQQVGSQGRDVGRGLGGCGQPGRCPARPTLARRWLGRELIGSKTGCNHARQG
jgi:hypothetical protein